jgi:hypothetical protein
MFPGGLLIETGDDLDLGRAMELTAAAVASDEIPTSFEVKFQHDGVLVRTDILERRARGEWRLIEVKAGALEDFAEPRGGGATNAAALLL